MKKSLLLGAAILFGCASNADAAKILTRDEAATEIVDGAIIALQCKDNNGGCNYFFNGNQQKTTHLTTDQLWKVVNSTTAGKFNLQRLSDGKYIGKSNANISLVDAKTDAAPFTAYGCTMDNGSTPSGPWTTKPESIDPNICPSIRFDTDGTFINAQPKGNVSKYASGTGGYSAWWVYKFTPEEVAGFEAIAGASYTPTPLPELANHNIVRSANPVTEVTSDSEGWYMIYSVGQQKYLKQQGKSLTLATFENGGDATENAGFLFRVSNALFSDFGTQYNNISSGYGDYVLLDGTDTPRFENGSASVVSKFPRSLSIENVSTDADAPATEFAIGDRVVNRYANGTQSSTFIGWQTSSNINKGEANNQFIFYPVNFLEEGETIVKVTVNIKYNGVTLSSRLIDDVAGTEITLNSPAFFNDVITFTLPDADQTMDIELTELALPFKHTPTTDNMIWQVIRHHSGAWVDKYFVWTVENGTAFLKTLPDHGNYGHEDTELWAFVGDFNTGFRIYNKSVGTGSYLYRDPSADTVQFGTTETANAGLWKPYVLTDQQANAWTDYCAFKCVAGGNYINMQNLKDSEDGEFDDNDTEGTAQLKYWSGADAGSACWFRPASYYMLQYSSTLTFGPKPIVGHEGNDHVVKYVPEEAVGARNFPDDFEYMTTGPEIIAAATAAPYDLDKADALKTLIKGYNDQVVLNQFDVNSWYRILSPCYGKYIRTSNTDMTMNNIDMDSHRKDYHTVFKFNQVEGTADSPLYTIYSQGLYFGQVTASQDVNMVEDPAQAGHFGPFDADDEPAIYGIGDFHADGIDASTSSQVYLHFGDEDANVTGWGKWAAGSHFILMPATDIEFDLDKSIGDKHVGFGFFPFAVSAATEGTTLHFLHEADGKLTTSETTVVPAHTAFIACSASATSVDLNIVPETAPAAHVQARAGEAPAAKVMAGTLRPGQAAENDYVLSEELADGGLGFKQVNSATAVAGNSVYLPAANLSEKALESSELPLSDPTTTSISEVTAEKASKVYYDLSGRRVANPKSGIYVTGNGKKIVL